MPLNAQNALSPTLLGMLACPSDDHAPLREEAFEGADTLVCTFCGTRFPIDNGIPVLLLDDATPGPNGVGVAGGRTGIEPPGAVVGGDTRPSPKHAQPDSIEDAGALEEPAVDETVGGTGAVTDVADIVEVADVLDADDVEPPAADVTAAEMSAADPDAADPDVTDPDAADPDAGSAPVVASPVSEPTDPRRPQNPPPARTLAAALRHRVEHRLAEHEANRGPRRRRGSGR